MNPEDYSLLIKFPTRGRTEKFFQILDMMVYYIARPDKCLIVINIDQDDNTITESFYDELQFYIDEGFNFKVIADYSKNKIDAVNRDMDKIDYPWDILLLMSDDMVCIQKDFDEVIRNTMFMSFPDTDGVLYFPDGYCELNTMPIIGRKYYERFNYIYNPEYKSFFCDDEFQRVSQLLGREAMSSITIFKHAHPVWTGQGWDALYEKNQLDWQHDEVVFNRRKLVAFGMGE